MGAAPGQRAGLTPPAELGTLSARAYAERLLAQLTLAPIQPLDLPDEHPALTWARSGLMALTGRADGPPLMCPAPIAACADGALAALASIAPAGAFDGMRGSELLAERAAITGYSRNGAISAGGSCRLLEAADGWIALNLAREDDWALLPAWFEADVHPEWEAATAFVRERPSRTLVERGRELGLAVAAEDTLVEGVPTAAWLASNLSSPRRRGSSHPGASRVCGNDGAALVVDLSSLWAGPLCSHLLQKAGARVIKIESRQRPDGARNGPPAFFELLNAGKQSVVLDFDTAEGRAQLRQLLARADIVIEGSRPRALRQLGIVAEDLARENPALTWISLTGYGRDPEQENWIAYGDDAAVAAGLSQLMFEGTGEHVFAGDATADPLTGLHAALAAWAGHRKGGAGLISVALCDVVRHCLEFDRPPTVAELRHRQSEWTRIARDHVELPRARAEALI